VVAASLLIVALCWWWIVAMAGDRYGPMTGAAAWTMTRRWDWPYVPLLFAMWSGMMVGMMLPSAAAAIVGYGRTQRGTPAGPVAPTCAFVAAYVLVWMLFSLAATPAQRLMYELPCCRP
jgi:predicted metal-binding membrane protein